MTEEPLATEPEPNLDLRAFFSRWWLELVQLDGPTWRTLRALLLSPGELSRRHLEPAIAHRAHHVHPVRLYLTINLLFFLLAPWVNSANISVWRIDSPAILAAQPALNSPLKAAIQRSGAQGDALFLAVLDERLKAQQGALVWMLIPAVGLAGFAVARKRRKYLVEHFVFATNLVSFILLSLLAVGLAGRLVVATVGTGTQWILLILIPIVAWLVWVVTVVYRSSRSFHEFSRHSHCALFTVWIGVTLYCGIWIYMQALFVVTLFGLRDLTFPS